MMRMRTAMMTTLMMMMYKIGLHLKANIWCSHLPSWEYFNAYRKSVLKLFLSLNCLNNLLPHNYTRTSYILPYVMNIAPLHPIVMSVWGYALSTISAGEYTSTNRVKLQWALSWFMSQIPALNKQTIKCSHCKGLDMFIIQLWTHPIHWRCISIYKNSSCGCVDRNCKKIILGLYVSVCHIPGHWIQNDNPSNG